MTRIIEVTPSALLSAFRMSAESNELPGFPLPLKRARSADDTVRASASNHGKRGTAANRRKLSSFVDQPKPASICEALALQFSLLAAFFCSVFFSLQAGSRE